MIKGGINPPFSIGNGQLKMNNCCGKSIIFVKLFARMRE